MHIVSFDKANWRAQLFPLVLTRPAGDLRVGILTIAEKWAKRFGAAHSFLSEPYLSAKFPQGAVDDDDVLVIRGNACPDAQLCEAVNDLEKGEALWSGTDFIALRTDRAGFREVQWDNLTPYKPVYYTQDYVQIDYPEHIFMNNGKQIQLDFDLLTKGRSSAPLSATNRFIGDHIFAEEGANAECATFNSHMGPVYLGKNSEVWEGCLIRGSFALCEGSQVKMGAKIYSNVTIGPYSRVGGELNTCVIWGNSSKGHEGYLGTAVMGEWCNWGADTNNSNLKNNYKAVRVYDYSIAGFRDTGLQFFGLIMGDHSKCAINTAFNTGTVVGVAASIFGSGLLPAYIPDFSWGGAEGLTTHQLGKMFETAKLVYERRNCTFDEVEKNLLSAVFDMTGRYRNQ